MNAIKVETVDLVGGPISPPPNVSFLASSPIAIPVEQPHYNKPVEQVSLDKVSTRPKRGAEKQMHKDFINSQTLKWRTVNKVGVSLKTSTVASKRCNSKHLEKKITNMMDVDKLLCLKCNKVFSSFSNLRRHVAIHIGWTRFKCKFCDYQAYNKSQCWSHLQKAHGVAEEDLEKATVSLSNPADMKLYEEDSAPPVKEQTSPESKEKFTSTIKTAVQKLVKRGTKEVETPKLNKSLEEEKKEENSSPVLRRRSTETGHAIVSEKMNTDKDTKKVETVSTKKSKLLEQQSNSDKVSPTLVKKNGKVSEPAASSEKVIPSKKSKVSNREEAVTPVLAKKSKVTTQEDDSVTETLVSSKKVKVPNQVNLVTVTPISPKKNDKVTQEPTIVSAKRHEKVTNQEETSVSPKRSKESNPKETPVSPIKSISKVSNQQEDVEKLKPDPPKKNKVPALEYISSALKKINDEVTVLEASSEKPLEGRREVVHTRPDKSSLTEPIVKYSKLEHEKEHKLLTHNPKAVILSKRLQTPSSKSILAFPPESISPRYMGKATQLRSSMKKGDLDDDASHLVTRSTTYSKNGVTIKMPGKSSDPDSELEKSNMDGDKLIGRWIPKVDSNARRESAPLIIGLVAASNSGNSTPKSSKSPVISYERKYS